MPEGGTHVRTVIFGAGALGGLFAYLLHRSGVNVALVEKDPAIVKAIRSGGLLVEGVSGPETVPVPIATTPDKKTTPDLVLALVKCHEVTGAAEAIKECLGPRTVVVSLQNGIGNEQILADALGRERVVAGATNIGAASLAPGHVLHTSWGDTTVGARDTNSIDRAEMVAGFFTRHGIKTLVADDLDSLLWGHVLLQVGFSAITSLTRVRNGKVMELEPAGALMKAAVREAAEIVKAAGISLPYHNPVSQVEQVLRRTPEDLSTMQQDLYKGKRSEVEAIHGAVVRLAESLDRSAPINWTLLQLVRTVEQAAGRD